MIELRLYLDISTLTENYRSDDEPTWVMSNAWKSLLGMLVTEPRPGELVSFYNTIGVYRVLERCTHYDMQHIRVDLHCEPHDEDAKKIRDALATRCIREMRRSY